MRRTTIALASLLALAACGSDSEAASLPCLDVPSSLLAAIAEGAEGVEFEITEGAAVRAPEFEEVYFVAGRMKSADLDDVGVWSTPSLDSPGPLLAVDGFAKEFTVWPDADSTSAKISAAEPGVDEARKCLAD